MWPFNKVVKCGRHKLLIALDNATAQEKAEKEKLGEFRKKRAELVGQLIYFAEDKYFARYKIREEEEAAERGWTITNTGYGYLGINAAALHFYGFPPQREADVFGATRGIVHYLDREDFKDYPETYELVRLIIGIIHDCDEAITKQEKVWRSATSARQQAVQKIEKSALGEV